MAKRLTSRVFMKLTVEVHVGNWEATETFAALHEQALREAQNSIRHVLKNTNIRLVDGQQGEMTVNIVEGN